MGGLRPATARDVSGATGEPLGFIKLAEKALVAFSMSSNDHAHYEGMLRYLNIGGQPYSIFVGHEGDSSWKRREEKLHESDNHRVRSMFTKRLHL